MIELTKHIGEGFANGELYDVLKQLQEGMLPVSGRSYYVSKYGNGTTGLSWENAFTTIASAIAASNTYLTTTGKGSGRNKMFIDGGALWAETIVTFPNQCDMIGVGARTGWRPTIYGATAITTAVTGCHIYNIAFNNPNASGKCVVIPDASHGIEFHHCTFSGAASSTHGLQLGSIADFVVDDCKFVGNPPAVRGILLEGSMAIGYITNNFIGADTIGIEIAEGTTASYGLLIKNNVITHCNPNTTAELGVGIQVTDIQCRGNETIVNNWINAANAINYSGASWGANDENHCIGNTIVEGGTSTMETVIVDG